MSSADPQRWSSDDVGEVGLLIELQEAENAKTREQRQAEALEFVRSLLEDDRDA